MKLLNFTIIMLIFLIPFMGVAKNDPLPDPVLAKGDIEKFVKTWPLLEKDFKNFGMKMDARGGNVTMPESVMVGNKYLSILKKHGWDENFWSKFTVILQGYSHFEYKKGKKEANIGMSKSMKELEKNPHLSPEMKKKLIANLKMVEGALAQQGKLLQNSINPKDLEFIKPNLDKIKKVIDKNKNDSQ